MNYHCVVVINIRYLILLNIDIFNTILQWTCSSDGSWGWGAMNSYRILEGNILKNDKLEGQEGDERIIMN